MIGAFGGVLLLVGLAVSWRGGCALTDPGLPSGPSTRGGRRGARAGDRGRD